MTVHEHPYALAAVITAHSTAIAWLCVWLPVDLPLGTLSSDSLVVTTLVPTPTHHVIPRILPLPKLATVQVQAPTLTAVTFADPDALVPEVIGAMSAPHPAPIQNASVDLYAKRAGLTSGQAVTVVMNLEVRADGSVGNVKVEIGSGDPSVDQEAISYVLAMRWIPGSVKRDPRSMRIRYPVTLSVT